MTYRRVYTPAQLQEIELLRSELRERLTCPDSEYEAAVERHRARRDQDTFSTKLPSGTTTEMLPGSSPSLM